MDIQLCFKNSFVKIESTKGGIRMKQSIQDFNMFFYNFSKQYDTTNSNIVRKIIHSYDVAKRSYDIACVKGFNEKDRMLAYLTGLLHDLGRFEQWKQFGSYDDLNSIDHGDLSFKLLEELNCCKLFGLTKAQSSTLKISIKYHNKPYLGKDKNVVLFNNILKNADAFSNVITTANGEQRMTSKKNGYTEEILKNFLSQKPIYSLPLTTKLDRCLKLASNTYNITESFLRESVLKYRYLDCIFETFSKYLNKTDKLVFRDAIDNLKIDYLK